MKKQKLDALIESINVVIASEKQSQHNSNVERLEEVKVYLIKSRQSIKSDWILDQQVISNILKGIGILMELMKGSGP